MATICPICGNDTMLERQGEYRFDPPNNIPGGTIIIADASWLECSSCDEQIFSQELTEALELMRYERLGLLHPREIEGVRKRMGLTQVEMAQLLGVGDKTYARWESGKSLHNKSSDNMIRLVSQDPGLFERLQAARDPSRNRRIADYVSNLGSNEGCNSIAMAAHGGELDSGMAEALRKRIQLIMGESVTEQ